MINGRTGSLAKIFSLWSDRTEDADFFLLYRAKLSVFWTASGVIFIISV